MNRLTVKRFDITRTATVVAFIYMLLTLIVGLLVFLPMSLLFGAAFSQIPDAPAEVGGIMAGGAVGVLIMTGILSLVYFVVGWIGTAIACAIYNFAAGRVGGITVDVIVEGQGGGYQGGYQQPVYQQPAPQYQQPYAQQYPQQPGQNPPAAPWGGPQG